MLLNPIELHYEAIYSSCATQFYSFSSIIWVHHSLDYGTSSDVYSHVFPTHDSIKEIMMLVDAPWDDHHHLSSFLDSIEDNLIYLYLPNIIESFMCSVSIQEVYFENNFLNIEEIIHLDICIKLGIVKNIHISVSISLDSIKTYKALFQDFRYVFSWSYK